MVNPGSAVSRDQASWALASFLVAFVLWDSELMSFTVGLYFGYWEIQFLEVTGPSCVTHQVRLSCQSSLGE